MSAEPAAKPKLAVVLVALRPGTSPLGGEEELHTLIALTGTLTEQCPGGSFEVFKAGVVLVDLDACFPGVLSLVAACNSQPYRDKVNVAVMECSEAAAILSPHQEGARQLLEERLGRKVRLTRTPPPSPQKRG